MVKRDIKKDPNLRPNETEWQFCPHCQTMYPYGDTPCPNCGLTPTTDKWKAYKVE